MGRHVMVVPVVVVVVVPVPVVCRWWCRWRRHANSSVITHPALCPQYIRRRMMHACMHVCDVGSCACGTGACIAKEHACTELQVSPTPCTLLER